jgi:epoxyqueuosine reductase
MNVKVNLWQDTLRLLGPFDELESGRGKEVAKAGFFKLAGIVEAVKVKMPDVQAVGLMRLNNSIAWAFDATFDTEGAQQVAHERGLASAEVAVQCDDGVSNGGALSQRLRECSRGRFINPAEFSLGAFYNRLMSSEAQIISNLRSWARELGFSQIGVAPVDLSSAEPGLRAWLEAGFHGQMQYMAAHGMKRARPAELVPGTASVITVRMDYLPASHAEGWQAIEFERLKRPDEAIVSIYARGRDYHKVLRNRLQKLADRMTTELGVMGYRVFTDSAPVLEAELAARSGIGWRGKHTLILSREAGSMFFLGEIYVDRSLPLTDSVSSHCGSCSACMDVCPTQAIVAPYTLDARRCISYLTIEHEGSIPLELRPLIGNRIYGCDDCQLACPWNKYAQRAALPDFDEREGLTGQQLVTLMGWSEADFLRYTEGSAIRRIGHERWQRNIAVAMGNALRSEIAQNQRSAVWDSLVQSREAAHDVLKEHIDWALLG